MSDSCVTGSFALQVCSGGTLGDKIQKQYQSLGQVRNLVWSDSLDFDLWPKVTLWALELGLEEHFSLWYEVAIQALV